MATKKAEKQSTEIQVQDLKQADITLRIIGTEPMLQNRMSAKVKQYLLVGGRKKTAAERLEIKHDPIAEYQDSVEKLDNGPTFLGLRVAAIKTAMCSAALETAGVTKTSAQRLLFMPGDLCPLYGTPSLRMDVVRSADMNKTPDIRSRAFFEKGKWGAVINIKYITPQLSANSVITLLCNAGVLIGVGDGRQEKGKLSFGTFRVLGHGQEDKEWDDLVKNHARMQQMRAWEKPEAANEETAGLLEFIKAEQKKRRAA